MHESVPVYGVLCCGRLFAGMLGKQGIAAEQMLYDFNDMAFQKIAAPY
jgi:hypothetical protein